MILWVILLIIVAIIAAIISGMIVNIRWAKYHEKYVAYRFKEMNFLSSEEQDKMIGIATTDKQQESSIDTAPSVMTNMSTEYDFKDVETIANSAIEDIA